MLTPQPASWIVSMASQCCCCPSSETVSDDEEIKGRFYLNDFRIVSDLCSALGLALLLRDLIYG